MNKLFSTQLLLKNSSRSLLQSTSIRMFHVHKAPPTADENPITFKFGWVKQTERVLVRAREGETLLEVAHNNGLELEGACESSLACSTCHVILQDEMFDALEEPCEEEEDLLDLAYGLTATSRLGC